MEIEWQSSFHLDFSTWWQSVEYMEAYLRRRRKAKIREKIDKLMIKDETQRPETYPTTPATVKRPRFSNIEDMLDKPLAVVMVPRINKGNRQGSTLRISTAGTISETPKYDLPRLRPVHVEVREIPLPTHIQQMTILSLAGNSDRRPKYLGQSPKNNDDRGYNGNSTLQSWSKLPQIPFPITDYHKNPTARELTQNKRQEKTTRWVSDSVKHHFMYSNGSTGQKEKKSNGRKQEKHSPNCHNEVILKYGAGQKGQVDRGSGCATVRYVGDVKLRNDSKETLQLVAKQQPIHPKR